MCFFFPCFLSTQVDSGPRLSFNQFPQSLFDTNLDNIVDDLARLYRLGKEQWYNKVAHIST